MLQATVRALSHLAYSAVHSVPSSTLSVGHLGRCPFSEEHELMVNKYRVDVFLQTATGQQTQQPDDPIFSRGIVPLHARELSNFPFASITTKQSVVRRPA